MFFANLPPCLIGVQAWPALLGLAIGPAAPEAAARGLVALTTGIIVVRGEIFGGRAVPVIAR